MDIRSDDWSGCSRLGRNEASWPWLYSGLQLAAGSGGFIAFLRDKDEDTFLVDQHAVLLQRTEARQAFDLAHPVPADRPPQPDPEVVDERWFVQGDLSAKMLPDCRKWLLARALSVAPPSSKLPSEAKAVLAAAPSDMVKKPLRIARRVAEGLCTMQRREERGTLVPAAVVAAIAEAPPLEAPDDMVVDAGAGAAAAGVDAEAALADILMEVRLEMLLAERCKTIVAAMGRQEYNNRLLRSVMDANFAREWRKGNPGPIEALLCPFYAAKPELEEIPEVERNLELARTIRDTERRKWEEGLQMQVARLGKRLKPEELLTQLEGHITAPDEYDNVKVSERRLFAKRVAKGGRRDFKLLPGSLADRETAIADAAEAAKLSREDFERNVKRKLDAAKAKRQAAAGGKDKMEDGGTAGAAAAASGDRKGKKKREPRARFTKNQAKVAALFQGGSRAPITHSRELARQDAGRQVAFVNIKVCDPPAGDELEALRFYCIHNMRGMGNPFDIQIPRSQCELLGGGPKRDMTLEAEKKLAEAIVGSVTPRRAKGPRHQGVKRQLRANDLPDLCTGAQQNALVDFQRELGAWRLPAMRKWLAWDIWPLGSPSWLRHDAEKKVQVIRPGFLITPEKEVFDSFMAHGMIEREVKLADGSTRKTSKKSNALISCIVLLGRADELFAGEPAEADPLGLALLPAPLQDAALNCEMESARAQFAAFYADTAASALWRARFFPNAMKWLKKSMGRRLFMEFVLEAPDAPRHILSNPAERDRLWAQSKLARNMNFGIYLMMITDALFYPPIFAERLVGSDDAQRAMAERFAQFRDEVVGDALLAKGVVRG